MAGRESGKSVGRVWTLAHTRASTHVLRVQERTQGRQGPEGERWRLHSVAMRNTARCFRPSLGGHVPSSPRPAPECPRTEQEHEAAERMGVDAQKHRLGATLAGPALPGTPLSVLSAPDRLQDLNGEGTGKVAASAGRGPTSDDAEELLDA